MPFIVLACYLIIVNIIAVILTIIDKTKAQAHRWRISETTLIAISAIGGAIGMYITMHIIHHKTRKTKFMVGIPVIFITEILLFVILYFWIGVKL
ncbi:MAG: DUF1294 domain-containing protein [Acutalibacteraceae bacterium]|nr:DUF1294 domain-containing protein [Acutalibacteraceae bacterium]